MLTRLENLISLDKFNQEKEFQKEFSFYWNSQAHLNFSPHIYISCDEKLSSWHCGESKIKANQSFEVLLKPIMDPNPYWVKTSLKYNLEDDLWYLENLTVCGIEQISGLRTRIRGWDYIDNISDQVLSPKSFIKPKRMTTSRVGRAMSKKMEDKF